MKRYLATVLIVGMLVAPFTADAQAADLGSIVRSLQSLVSSLQARIASIGGKAFTAQVASSVSTTGLVGQWSFDEGGGTTASDGSGNGNTGTLSNGTSWSPGKVGSNALLSSGTGQYVAVPNSASLSPVSQMTVALWANQSSLNGSVGLVGKWLYNTQESWLLRVRSNGLIRVNIAPRLNDNYTTYADTPAGSWTAGSWHHVAFVYDGTQAGNANRLKIYIDGAQQQLTFGGTIPATLQNANANLLIGAEGAGSAAATFNGSLDEVAIYNRVLNGSEIAALAGSGSGATQPPPSVSQAPSVTSFTPSPSSVTSGQPVTLSWTTANATSVGISGVSGAQPASGSVTVSPTQTTTYTLTASNGTQTATAQATVTVSPATTPIPSGNAITVNPSVKYQTMDAWEATAYSGHDQAGFSQFKSALFDAAVNDLGINRIRLEVRTGAENSIDYWTQYKNGQISKTLWNCYRYSAVDDNNFNPSVINSAGFTFNEFDDTVDKVILPLRQLSAARGEKMSINLNVVDFNRGVTATGCPAGLQSFHHSNPQEYAELVLATYKHLQSKYGFVPDYVEAVLEPDNTTWTATEIGNAIVATANLMSQNGFTVKFIAPSTTNGPASRTWFDVIAAVPGALQHLDTISYHRYVNADAATTASIASRGAQYGKKTAMLELIGATADTLHLDLKTGNNSSWQQFTIGGPGSSDTGAGYFLVNTSNTVSLGSRTKFLRQYFKFVRNGATRIDAQSTNSAFDPIAFRNAGSAAYGDVVVVKATAGGTFSVSGLSAGTYGIKYTTGDRNASVNQYDVDAPDQTIATGGAVTATMPSSGVMTIYGKKSGTPSPITLPTPTNQAPTVNAGADQTVSAMSASLSGSASDDGLPAGSSVASVWSKVSGPGTVAFVDPAQKATTATFSLSGTYVLRLTASDGTLSSSDEVAITVNAALQPLPSSKFIFGDRVQTTSNLNVRSAASASGPLLGVQSAGALGTVIGGPTFADSYWWWNINYDGGADGWSVEDFLNKLAAPAPAPTPAPSGSGNAWFVAPNGTTDAVNGGTAMNPWDIYTAFSHPSKIQAGDTVYLRGGTYAMRPAQGLTTFDAKFRGTASAPITVRSYPGEWAVLDGNLSTEAVKNQTVLLHSAGGYTIFRDFEITNTDATSRLITQTYADNSNPPVRRGNGMTVQVRGDKAINIVLHDTGSGLTAYQAAPDFEAHGMVIYNNGWDAPGRLHGHGIYTHGDNGYKLYSDNITGDNFGLTFRVGGSTNSVVINNYTLSRNVMTGGQVIIGTTPVTGLVFDRNYLYGPVADFGYTGSNNISQDMQVTDNYLIGGFASNPFTGHLEIKNNTVRGTATLFLDSAWTPGLPVYDLANNTYHKSNNNFPYWQFKVNNVPNSSNPYAVGYYGFNCTQGSQAQTCNYLKNAYESWQQDLKLDQTSTFVDGAMTGVKAFVNPIYNDSGLANVIVFNFDKNNSVQVDISNLGWSTGATYELRSTLDYFGDVIRGTYDGSGIITVPMTGHTIAKPIGYDQTTGWYHYSLPQSYFPEFGVFRLIRTSGTGSSSPVPTPSPVPAPVTNAPVIGFFGANPASVVTGNSSALSWAVSGATSISLNQGIGTVTGTSLAVAPSLTTTYVLTAANSAGTDTASATVVVTQPASYTIVASAGVGGAISPAGGITVASGANQSFSVSPSSGFRIKDVTVNGVSVGAVSSHTFSNVTANHSIAASFEQVPVASPAPIVAVPSISSFTASPASIQKGGSANLSWSVSGATALAVNGAPVTGSSLSVSPGQTSSYTLTATNSGGSVSAQVVVAVSTPPIQSSGGGGSRTRTISSATAYSSPSTLSGIQGSLISNTSGTVIGTQDGFSQVNFDNGVTGWTESSKLNFAAPTSVGSGFVFIRGLTVGSTGQDVIELQKILIARGYLAADSATGYFGPLTRAAIGKFQVAEGIAKPGGAGYGTVGPMTRSRLNALGASETSFSGGTGALVDQQRQAMIESIKQQISLLLSLVQSLMSRIQTGN